MEPSILVRAISALTGITDERVENSLLKIFGPGKMEDEDDDPVVDDADGEDDESKDDDPPKDGDGNPLKTNSACKCGQHQDKEPLTMKTKDERISALIASKKNTFADAHKAFLATLSEDQLKQLEDADAAIAEPKEEPKVEAVVEPKVEAAVEPKTEPTVASAKPITVADLPAELKDLVDNAKAHDATVRAGAIKALAESKQTVYSEADLKAMSTKDLVRVATLVSKPGATSVVDFSMQNLQGVAPVEESDVIAAPKPLATLFAKK